MSSKILKLVNALFFTCSLSLKIEMKCFGSCWRFFGCCLPLGTSNHDAVHEKKEPTEGLQSPPKLDADLLKYGIY